MHSGEGGEWTRTHLEREDVEYPQQKVRGEGAAKERRAHPGKTRQVGGGGDSAKCPHNDSCCTVTMVRTSLWACSERRLTRLASLLMSVITSPCNHAPHVNRWHRVEPPRTKHLGRPLCAAIVHM